MKTLTKEIVDKLSEVEYRGIPIYRYVIDNVVCVESEEEVSSSAEYSFKSDIHIEVNPCTEIVKTYVNNFLQQLPERDILFATFRGRKLINGKKYSTVLDPYIDVINPDKYVVIEGSEAINISGDFYTRNLNIYFIGAILARYRVDDADWDELYNLFEDEFFSVLEENGYFFPKVQKEAIVSKAGLCYAMRKAYVGFFKDVLNQVKPKVVCYSHGPYHSMCYLYEAAHELGIPCLEVDHGALAYEYELPPKSKHADVHISYSEISREISQRKGVTDVVAIGKPGVYQLAEKYIGKQGSTDIISVISSLEEGMLDFAGRLSGMLDDSRYTVLYKRHSMELWDEQKEKRIREKYPKLSIMIPEVDINELYKITQIVIGERSTAIVEALPYRKIKVMTREIPGDRRYEADGGLGFFYELKQSGDITGFETDEEAVKEITDYEFGKDYRSEQGSFWCDEPERRFRELIESYTG